MLIVGLTGGIASGKTTVADLLAARGAALIDTDLLAREVVLPGQPAYEEITAAWPDVALTGGGLDRAKLGAIVFGDEAARARLNGMTHPRIRALMAERLAALDAGAVPVAVLVVPLLFENGLDATVQESWLVAVAPAVQRERLVTRDGFTPEEADQRIASQMPLEAKLIRATRVIRNDGDRAALEAEVARVWAEAGLL
ncbi:MAG: dephospho-coenzyme kinase [Cyanobacteria bacterium RYN_339]|nr:dephospho-coenzyme kinase [Cyanobacteria bacterium RYN_339]